MISFKDSRALRADARESLLGHLTTTVTALLLYMFSTSVLAEMVNGLDSGSVLLSLALSVMVFFVVNTCGYMLRIGLAYIFMRLAFRQGARIGDLFCAFRKNSNTAVTLSGFMALLELFCMLPLLLRSLFCPHREDPPTPCCSPFCLRQVSQQLFMSGSGMPCSPTCTWISPI